ncbi:DUF5304 family protein [Nonomuraea muscovyensis]|uniref:Uncharacterized protein n=1 Tax=Nonomuraea muscovyensis TaxID=1124761 RepID=A0A7X0EU73_9ACTN|nr:DUF5304 family protein [Nonomuraea muscovyensis]MBB6344118.1 hypothetical protein [Nonomuraea muscovyensis]MDF2708223.1 hypothetical protein [Nonomuraea muscovyensis]
MSETQDRRDPAADPIGTVADEARKLFDALQGRATRHVGRTVLNSFTGGGGGGSRERDVWGEAVAEPEEEYICRACPVCRAIAAQRESGNDVTSHLVAAGGELFAAFRQTIDVLSRPAPRGPRTEGGGDGGESSGPPRDDGPGTGHDQHGRDSVQHIDLG